MSGWRLVQIGGAALALVMIVLLAVGATPTAYLIYAALLLVGGGIFAYARKADEDIKKRQRDEEFRARNAP